MNDYVENFRNLTEILSTKATVSTNWHVQVCTYAYINFIFIFCVKRIIYSSGLKLLPNFDSHKILNIKISHSAFLRNNDVSNRNYNISVQRLSPLSGTFENFFILVQQQCGFT